MKRIILALLIVLTITISLIYFMNTLDLAKHRHPTVYVLGFIGSPLNVDDLNITVEILNVAQIDVCRACVVESIEDLKVVEFIISIKNIGEKVKNISTLRMFELETDAKKRYKYSYILMQSTAVDPGNTTYITTIFTIPIREKPIKLSFEINTKYVIEILINKG